MEGCIGDIAKAFHLQPAQAKGGRAKNTAEIIRAILPGNKRLQSLAGLLVL